LSLDQSNQLYSPNGKITPAVLLPLMPNRHFLVNTFDSDDVQGSKQKSIPPVQRRPGTFFLVTWDKGVNQD